jgi:uncharacterized membrane protein
MTNMTGVEPRSSLVNWTQAIYALHALILLTGILGAASVIGAFLTGWPSIIAVILNYVKRGERAARGSSRISAGRFARSGAGCCGSASASAS